MKYWLNLKITRQFLIFFLCTCILPLGVMGALFFQSLDKKFSERLSRSLDIGLLFARQVYQKDLEKLALSTTEASNFSLRPAYQEFSRTGVITALENTMNRYFELRSLDILNLYNASGNRIAHAGFYKALSPHSYRMLIRQAFGGKTVHSIERFELGTEGSKATRFKLEYISVSPIFSHEGTREVAGVLVTGQSMAEHFSIKDFLEALPEMGLRIYAPKDMDSPYQLVYSSLPNVTPTLPKHALITTQSMIKQRMLSETDTASNFEERINQEPYKSKALILHNFIGDPVAVLVVSTSEKDLMELKLRNALFVLIYLVFALAVITLSGLWFKRSFVDPMEALSVAADQVAQGNLDTVVVQKSAQWDIHKTISSFNKMIVQLKEDQRLRGNFVSMLTHDLRTPLIAQKRVLEIYEELGKELPPEMGKLNAGLLNNNNHLLDMVNKLLETYQYEAGKIRLHPESCSLFPLVEDCLQDVHAWAQQKNITLINQVPTSLPVGLWDRAQLRRVFQNLIGNALANIQEGRKVLIQAGEIPTRANYIWIEFSDNGPGIQSEVLPLLFTRYFTGDRRQKIGTGLGLYICRIIVELHGGAIQVSSEMGAGTTFTIHLPLTPPLPPPPSLMMG